MRKDSIPYKKYIKDGKVAILVSSGFGAGWYTWNSEYLGMLYDSDIVEAVLREDFDAAGKIAEAKYEGVYLGGLYDLYVEWLPEGTPFYVHEYDGYESLRTGNDLYMTA